MTTTAWAPGQPLHSPPLRLNPVYNWRDSSEGPVCNCADAARWPIPSAAFWDLGCGDELERFITETRALHGAPTEEETPDE